MSFKIKCYVEEREEVHFKNERQEEREEEQWEKVSQLQLKSWERWKWSANFDF